MLSLYCPVVVLSTVDSTVVILRTVDDNEDGATGVLPSSLVSSSGTLVVLRMVDGDEETTGLFTKAKNYKQ